jgi:regulator of sigma E protease
MLDEREGSVDANELSQAFTQKKPYQKIAIALAGPVANFLFAIAAFALMYSIGVRELTPLLDDAVPSSLAAEFGVERGDQIKVIDGQPISSFSDIGLALAARVGDTGTISVVLDRSGKTERLQIPVNSWLANSQSPNPIREIGFLPQYPIQPAVIGNVDREGAAFKAGLQTGDLILSSNGIALEDWSSWVDVIRANENNVLKLELLRDGSVVNLDIRPGLRELENGQQVGYIGAGTIPQPWPDDQLLTKRYWPGEAVVRGFNDTSRMISLSYSMLGKMVSGKVSLKQIGGPISMAQMAGMSVESGFEAFVSFLALISISLGIVNLLPVPVLDGGHVVMHTIEWIKGRPLTEKTQLIGMQIGMAFIVMLMCLAFVNDIGRLM